MIPQEYLDCHSAASGDTCLRNTTHESDACPMHAISSKATLYTVGNTCNADFLFNPHFISGLKGYWNAVKQQ